MNVILEFVLAGTDNFNFQTLLSAPVKAFMDDLFLVSPYLQEIQILLDHAFLALSWARMSVNPSKSRNLVFEKGKVLNENVLSIMVNRSKYSIPPI